MLLEVANGSPATLAAVAIAAVAAALADELCCDQVDP